MVKVDTKIFGAYDLLIEMKKLDNKRRRFEKFLKQPRHLEMRIKKLEVDIDGYRKGLSCILRDCDSGTLTHFESVMGHKYRDVDIKGLVKELLEQPADGEVKDVQKS